MLFLLLKNIYIYASQTILNDSSMYVNGYVFFVHDISYYEYFSHSSWYWDINLYDFKIDYSIPLVGDIA